MKDGFIKVAAATPDVRVADCEYNATEIIRMIHEMEEQGAKVMVFPELCITAYTCGDLVLAGESSGRGESSACPYCRRNKRGGRTDLCRTPVWNTMVSFIMWQQDSITVKSLGLYRRRICQTIMSFMRQDILLQESMSTARFTLTAKRTKNGMTAILMTWNLTLRWHLLMSLKNSKKLMMKISAARTSMMKTFSMMTRCRGRAL